MQRSEPVDDLEALCALIESEPISDDPVVCNRVLRLIDLVRREQARYAHFWRKVNHRCLDAYCPECDKGTP